MHQSVKRDEQNGEHASISRTYIMCKYIEIDYVYGLYNVQHSV